MLSWEISQNLITETGFSWKKFKKKKKKELLDSSQKILLFLFLLVVVLKTIIITDRQTDRLLEEQSSSGDRFQVGISSNIFRTAAVLNHLTHLLTFHSVLTFFLFVFRILLLDLFTFCVNIVRKVYKITQRKIRHNKSIVKKICPWLWNYELWSCLQMKHKWEQISAGLMDYVQLK